MGCTRSPGPRSWPHRGGRGAVYAAAKSSSAAWHRPARPGPAPLTSVHQFEVWDFLLRFLSENSMVRRAGRAGAAAGAARRWTEESGGRGGGGGAGSVTRQRERGTASVSWIRRGGTSKGKPLDSPGLRPAGPQRSPGRRLPPAAPLSSPPDPGLIPGRRARRRRSRTFRWGASWGRGRAGRGRRRPGARRGPAWVQLRTRRRRRRARPRGRGRAGRGRRRRRRQGAAGSGRWTAPAGGGAPDGGGAAGTLGHLLAERGRRHPPGARAAATHRPGRAAPGGGARGRGAAPSARPAHPPPGPPSLPGAGIPTPVPRGPASRPGLPGEPGSRPELACIFPGPIWFSTALGVGDPSGQPTSLAMRFRVSEGQTLVSGKF